MAEALKDFYNKDLIKRLANDVARAHKGFNKQVFIQRAQRGLDKLELLARAQHIKNALRDTLDLPYPEAMNILLRSMGPELTDTNAFAFDVFYYLPHTHYVASEGLEHFELSMRANYELTKRFSAESSIRPYIERFPKQTFARLQLWASDSNTHVRRLVSEGTRTRLPWASRVGYLFENPQQIVELLELLKDDPELYVRRSVANNLNDLSKDFPELVLDICERWSENKNAERQALIKHALRTLIKKTHPRALKLMGASTSAQATIVAVIAPKRVKIGGSVQVTLRVTSASKKAQRLIVDLVVHFIKANGKSQAKVFKGSAFDLAPQGTFTFKKTISLKQHTTRKHYPGKHRVDALINGQIHTLGAFQLTA